MFKSVFLSITEYPLQNYILDNFIYIVFFKLRSLSENIDSAYIRKDQSSISLCENVFIGMKDWCPLS